MLLNCRQENVVDVVRGACEYQVISVNQHDTLFNLSQPWTLSGCGNRLPSLPHCLPLRPWQSPALHLRLTLFGGDDLRSKNGPEDPTPDLFS